MSAENTSDQTNASAKALPKVRFQRPEKRTDLATILGLVFAFGFIIGAILLGQSNANFFNVPSLMIVLFGTMAATAVSYTGAEIKKAGNIIAKSIFWHDHTPSQLASSLVDLAVVAKKKGILGMSSYEKELQKDPFLFRAIQMVIDGYPAQNVERLLTQEIDLLVERHKRSASLCRRASEVAPAMGLIGTLVGLVQMLADLENPETIGPAMAVALLTTFYGAILGTIVMAPLAVKLEKNSADEALIKTLITVAATSIAQQDNPRQLEMLLNAQLPPSERIVYFD
ncbi:MAG: motility protein A [Alphaproteobacteria bacterium]